MSENYVVKIQALVKQVGDCPDEPVTIEVRVRECSAKGAAMRVGRALEPLAANISSGHRPPAKPPR